MKATRATRATLFVLLAAGSPLLAPAHASTLLTGGTETETDGTYSANFNVGYSFTSTINQSVTALGLWDSLSDGFGGQTYQVGIWNTSTTALLGSVTIDAGDGLDTSVTVAGGQWRYETLGTTILLAAGTSYTLAFNTGASGLTADDALHIDYPTLTNADTVTIADEVRFLSAPGLAFPNGTGSAGSFFYGMANAQIVPEPGSSLLLAAGLAALGLRRRRADLSGESSAR